MSHACIPTAADPHTPILRLLLVDDRPALREVITATLGKHPDLVIVGEAGNGVEAIAQARALLPDVILMDYSMPVMNGQEATRRICAEFPGMRIVGHSMHSDDSVRQSMLRAGARAFVAKNVGLDGLLAAVRGVS